MNVNPDPDATAWTVEELRMELDRYEDGLLRAGKARNTITTYVYPVDRFLNWLDRPYTPVRTGEGHVPHGRTIDGMASPPSGRSRYDALRAYLSERSEPQLRMTFVEIERIIGQPLPSSARRHRAWWANERSGTHVHARSWLEANPPRRTANVDLSGEMADFVLY